MYNPRLRANSGMQDGRDFNKRGGGRGWQPVSFRSCTGDSEHTDQKAAQVASAPPGPLSEVKTKFMEIRQKVGRNRARWIRLGYECFSCRTILPASQPAKRGGRQAAGRSQMPWRRQVCGGSEFYRRSPRRQRRQAIQPNEQSNSTTREANRSNSQNTGE